MHKFFISISWTNKKPLPICEVEAWSIQKVHLVVIYWYTSKMEVHSLAELKEKSGIETSIF